MLHTSPAQQMERSETNDPRRLERVTPESQGVASEAILSLVSALDQPELGMHSLMVLRNGNVIGEGWWKPYQPDQRHIMFSVSKSITATAIGMAEEEGLLSIDDPILSFFPSYASPEVVRNVRELKVRHLLQMATGHSVDTMEVMRALPHEDWVKVFLDVPVIFPPGTHFLYNSGASFVLAALLTSRTGHSVLDYLTERLFQPLGIETPPWEVNPRGINLGASGLRLYTEDLAKIGQLHLQRGLWNGKRLLTEEWVSAATTSQVSTGDDSDGDWGQGYGYQWWRTRHNGFRADGAHGQFSLVMPDQGVVVAMTAGTAHNRQLPALVWEHLEPGLHDDRLAERPQQLAALHEKIQALEVVCPVFLPVDPSAAAELDGRWVEVSFNTFGVQSLRVSFSESSILLTLRYVQGSDELTEVGRTDWLPGYTKAWPYEEMTGAITANRGGWTSEQTLEIHQQCVETPYRRVWLLSLNGGELRQLSVGMDLGFWEQRTENLEAKVR